MKMADSILDDAKAYTGFGFRLGSKDFEYVSEDDKTGIITGYNENFLCVLTTETVLLIAVGQDRTSQKELSQNLVNLKNHLSMPYDCSKQSCKQKVTVENLYDCSKCKNIGRCQRCKQGIYRSHVKCDTCIANDARDHSKKLGARDPL